MDANPGGRHRWTTDGRKGTMESGLSGGDLILLLLPQTKGAGEWGHATERLQNPR